MAENAEHTAVMFGIILLLHRPRRCIVANGTAERKPECRNANVFWLNLNYFLLLLVSFQTKAPVNSKSRAMTTRCPLGL
jgi:hypothetical protein